MVQGSGSRVHGSGLRAQGSEFMFHSSCFMVHGSEFRVESSTQLDLRRAGPSGRFYLEQCMNSMVFESHLPKKIVNSLFTITKNNIKLTLLWGS